MEENWVDEVSWADPQIRRDYEAALGRVILAHNALDYYLGLVLEVELARRGLDAIEALQPKPFERRLRLLQQLAVGSDDPYVRNLRYEDAARLNTDRNKLAHGYFEQNPFDGDYLILAQGQRHDYPLARLEEIRAALDAHAEAFREAYLVAHFDPLPPLSEA